MDPVCPSVLLERGCGCKRSLYAAMRLDRAIETGPRCLFPAQGRGRCVVSRMARRSEPWFALFNGDT
jgi:hypothetical protein